MHLSFSSKIRSLYICLHAKIHKSLNIRCLTRFFVQKKVLIGGDSHIFRYIIPLFNLHKKCIKGYDSHSFWCISGVIRGVFFRSFVPPFVPPIVPPKTKKGHFCPSLQVPLKYPLKTVQVPFDDLLKHP